MPSATNPSESRGSLRGTLPLAVALLVTLSGSLALADLSTAKECGDDVRGERVACACGDSVVSDTRLQVQDPVVRGRCSGDGLTLHAQPFDESLVLDLAGLSIVGSGFGNGIAVTSGGSDGAVIVGGTKDRRGQIVGFGTGVRVRSGRTLRRIETLDLDGQRHDGLTLLSAGTFVVDVRASRNGGDGIRVAGQGGRLLGVEATENRRAGLRVSSRYTVVEARAEHNGEHGIVLRGARVDLRGSVATRNRGFGIVMSGYGHSTEGVVTDGNEIGGISVGQGSGAADLERKRDQR